MSPEDASWIDALNATPQVQREEVAERILAATVPVVEAAAESATQTGNRLVLHVLALGLAQIGFIEQAVLVFQRAVDIDPASIIDRVNVGVGLLHSGEANLAREWLGSAAIGPDPASEVARAYLAEIDRVQEAYQRNIKYSKLMLAYLIARYEAGTASHADKIRAGREAFALGLSGQPGTEHSWDVARRVLEPMRAEDPGDVEVLELLTGVYSTAAPALVEDVLRELERIAPNSAVLDIEVTAKAEKDNRRMMSSRSSRLLEEATLGGARAAAAVETLREFVRRFPTNEDYRVNLAYGLISTGDLSGAIAVADEMAELPGPNHARHFNLCQMYWFAGAKDIGRQHLAKAYQLAESDGDREDCEPLMRQFDEVNSGQQIR